MIKRYVLSKEYSNEIKALFQQQLTYDHMHDVFPTNTRAVIDIQHSLIINTAYEYSKKNKIFALDIGCGWGDFSNELGEFIEDYIGVEPSITELNRFTLKNKRYLVNGVGEYLDFISDNSRNLVLLISVLDHCFDWYRVYENCKRILAPGGLLIISMENFQKLPVMIKKSLGVDIVHKGHTEMLTFDDLEKLLLIDFNIKEKKSIGYLYGFHQLTKIFPVPKNILIKLNTLVDRCFNLIYPNGGQILFFSCVSTKTEHASFHFRNPFQCPSCYKEINFGQPECLNCNFTIPYIDNGKILDSLTIDKLLKNDIPT